MSLHPAGALEFCVSPSCNCRTSAAVLSAVVDLYAKGCGIVAGVRST
jgi:hypothetical protein